MAPVETLAQGRWGLRTNPVYIQVRLVKPEWRERKREM